jgi:hypothetical protein
MGRCRSDRSFIILYWLPWQFYQGKTADKICQDKSSVHFCLCHLQEIRGIFYGANKISCYFIIYKYVRFHCYNLKSYQKFSKNG